MRQMAERKVRSRAQELYESRGQEQGQELQDWFQAESEVLENRLVGPMYRKLRNPIENPESGAAEEINPQDSESCEVNF